jgi:uncharacterized membrane protein SpoIIM required for sporulation
MLEFLLSPKKAEKKFWLMFFVGLLYSSLSVFVTIWLFGSNIDMAKYSGILIVTFTVMFCIPFIYYMFKREEERTIKSEENFRVLKDHSKGILALLALFFGILIGYSLSYALLPSSTFAPQIETFCRINRPNNFEHCINQYGVGVDKVTGQTISGYAGSTDVFLAIFSNNVYVVIFTIIFSLIFGAGAIFVLAWNASVIAAAIGMYANSEIFSILSGLRRYMLHGTIEIAAYFFAALAGGILSIAITKREYSKERFWKIMQDVLNLVVIAIILLVIGSWFEVYITPRFFA